MRHVFLRFRALSAIALVATLLVGPTSHATASASGNSKIAPALAAVAAHAQPNDPLRVIVEGDGAGPAVSAHGVVRKALGFVGGVAATVRAGELERLATQPGVSLVAPDAPITLAATGAVSTSSLATVYPGRDAVSKPWTAGVTGRGVGIAVIDSGVTPSDAFGSRLVQVALDGQTGSLDDTVGHGTMVAGVAAGNSSDGNGCLRK
jgi:serine protease AprX